MVSTITPITRHIASGRLRSGGADYNNVGELERWLSVGCGGALAVSGLARGGWPGYALAALGGALLYRGFTGHCSVYGTFGFNTSEHHNKAASVAAGHGVKVTRGIIVHRSAAELFRMWRDLEGLPRFMSHLESVKCEDGRSHWVAHGLDGLAAEWDAEIINEEPGRLLAWRSLAGSEVATAGSVEIRQLPGEGGTEVRVSLKYDPPAGKLGAWLAELFGEYPERQIADDLRRFKDLAEAGAAAGVP
jgi:uncharacterized membrane protein